MNADLDPRPALRHLGVRRWVDRDLHADAEELLGVIGQDQVVVDVLAQEPPAWLVLECAGTPEPGVLGDLRPPAPERDRLRAEARESLEGGPPEGEVLGRERLLRAGEVMLNEPRLAGLAGGRDPAEPDRAGERIGLWDGTAGVRRQAETRDEVPAEAVSVGRPAGDEREGPAFERAKTFGSEPGSAAHGQVRDRRRHDRIGRQVWLIRQVGGWGGGRRPALAGARGG